MNKALLEKLIIEETKNLSVDVLNEILDYIHFLKARKRTKLTKQSMDLKIKNELSELDKMSLTHLEEEFANYKQLYPREG